MEADVDLAYGCDHFADHASWFARYRASVAKTLHRTIGKRPSRCARRKRRRRAIVAANLV
jgi:hypothetical protein